jgi:hypothetical protein
LLLFYLASSFCKIDIKLDIVSFLHRTREGVRHPPTDGWLEPRSIERVLDLGELFLDELKLVLDLVEQFGHLDTSILDLDKLFLEELKLILVLFK